MPTYPILPQNNPLIYRYSDVNPRYRLKSSVILDLGIDAINNSIENILGTTPGERIFLPTFGSKVSSLLFEPINSDTAYSILYELIDAISKWENRIQVDQTQSSVIAMPDSYAYQVTIVYQLLATDVVSSFRAIVSQ